MSEPQPDLKTNFTSFADWCLHKDNLSEGARETVKHLLMSARTSDCYQASEILSKRTELGFGDTYCTIDISPLSSLVNLTSLDLGYNYQLTDISPLSSLVNLKQLKLQGNSITDISPLSSLVNLTKLDLSSNKIKDISTLSSLVNLTSLGLCYTEIKDISLLSSLIYLKKLYLNDNQITDLIPFSSFFYLTELCLDRNQITDISPLSALTNLTKLTLDNNQIADISPLSTLTNLTYLDLYSNQIADISPLSALTNITDLSLGDNPITDLSPLQSLDQLYCVFIYEVYLSQTYFCPQQQWQAQWLLEEDNAELRRVLIQEIGYARLCQELQAEELDAWQEYTLLKIGMNKPLYFQGRQVFEEPVYLLKMLCPSTKYVHALRVPPYIHSAREAIRWVNFGIDPEYFAVQT